jgi:hypothetical protein
VAPGDGLVEHNFFCYSQAPTWVQADVAAATGLQNDGQPLPEIENKPPTPLTRNRAPDMRYELGLYQITDLHACKPEFASNDQDQVISKRGSVPRCVAAHRC